MYPEKNRKIIEQSCRGSLKAQYSLYNQYAKAMLNVSYRIMGTVEEAEDILQDSFTEAFSKLHTYRYDSAFGAWLKRIVVNKCINEVKRKKTDLSYYDELTQFNNHIEYEEQELPKYNIESIKKAMEQLPKGNKIIFSLYLLEGYDHREISQILNTSESNSKSQYMRAKRKIKEILERGNHE